MLNIMCNQIFNMIMQVAEMLFAMMMHAVTPPSTMATAVNNAVMITEPPGSKFLRNMIATFMSNISWKMVRLKVRPPCPRARAATSHATCPTPVLRSHAPPRPANIFFLHI